MIEYVASLNGKRINIFKDELSDLKSQSRIHLVVSLTTIRGPSGH